MHDPLLSDLWMIFSDFLFTLTLSLAPNYESFTFVLVLYDFLLTWLTSRREAPMADARLLLLRPRLPPPSRPTRAAGCRPHWLVDHDLAWVRGRRVPARKQHGLLMTS